MKTSFTVNYKYDYTLKRFSVNAVLQIAVVILALHGSAAAAESCTVRDCHDGDTCNLVCDGNRVKVRLHCIDAPEMQQAHWGRQSRDALRQRMPAGSFVQLERITQDRYGRTVGVLVYEGININLQQVHGGWAVTYPKYCSQQKYYQAQENAEARQRGVWQQAGSQQRPWEWRASKNTGHLVRCPRSV